ncbi:MAG: DUF2817 domain-containing protein [Bdellovibrionales bacterium]|nr:DUF2817 domain-containing protein [Bdellovibrionales bacterium]
MEKIEHFPSWATSAQNRPIEIFCSLKENEFPILLIGGVHGDEPEGIYLAKSLLRWLQNYDGSALKPWILIPCLNPDGALTNTRVNGNGVDLNRNFPARSWSPNHTQTRYFPGVFPGSEPEINALVKLIKEQKPWIIIHFHSWHPSIVCTGKPGFKIAQKFAKYSHYKIQDTIGYETPGSLSQFGWHDLQIPVICLEIEERLDKKKIWDLFYPAFKSVLSREESF